MAHYPSPRSLLLLAFHRQSGKLSSAKRASERSCHTSTSLSTHPPTHTHTLSHTHTHTHATTLPPTTTHTHIPCPHTRGLQLPKGAPPFSLIQNVAALRKEI